ncbi:MAG TPA: SRPBCC domain-containing protein [Solirubrobacteraceae bacterium]|nr:SRPBCC domain-containing protein [Solirubrobacteraceae bacterium]
MAVYRTTFPIDASSEVVWGVLVDFKRYPEWNPSLPSIAGDLRVGSTVSMTLAMPGRPSPKVKAELTEVVPRQRLVWHGNVGGDWLFAGDRQFIIDPGDGDTVNFTHVEDVHGLLFPLFRALMGSAIQRHHDALNTALTRRAEELAAGAASSH